jgi:energy-coupling factor transporter ATP-binding protein EcfA2
VREPSTQCPLGILGHNQGAYVFFDSAGQIRSLRASQLSNHAELCSLLEPHCEWAVKNFPELDRRGKATGHFDCRDTSRFLIGACHTAGIYNANLPSRGHGVWDIGGGTAVHLGDCVQIRDETGALYETRRAGFREGDALYPGRPAISPPAQAASAEIANHAESLFEKWTWSRPDEQRVFTGIWSAGMLGASIRWRPHAALVGQPGSGKSTLIALAAALSPGSETLNDYTEAGIRQSLSGRAAPLMLDEADSDNTAHLQQVVALLRKASGGAGAQSVRGTVGGSAQQFTFTSSVLMGSVLPPALLPQDSSRITRLDVVPVSRGSQPLPVDEMMEWASKNAPALWGRALAGIPRFKANLSVVQSEMRQRGCSPRMSDQIGTIIAARAMMLSDAPLDRFAACEDIERFGWLVQTADQEAEDAGPISCLMHLCSSASHFAAGGEHLLIGTLIYRARRHDESAGDALIEHGLMLKMHPRSGVGNCLWVANKHARLSKIFANTQWEAARWREDLRYLPGAEDSPSPQWFSGKFKSRCVLIPECLLPGADRITNAPAPPSVKEDRCGA